MNLSYRFFRILFLFIFKIFFRLKTIDTEKVPEKGGAIVATNHVSYLDPLVLGCAVKKRQVTFMARQGLFKIPLIGRFVKTFSFPVDRKKPQPSTIKEAVKRLKNGELIAMFPEGIRSKDGDLLDAKRGVAVIATAAGVEIIPAYIEGTHKALPVGAKFIRPARIKVIFGNPIKIMGTDKDFQEKLENDIMKAIKSLKKK